MSPMTQKYFKFNISKTELKIYYQTNWFSSHIAFFFLSIQLALQTKKLVLIFDSSKTLLPHTKPITSYRWFYLLTDSETQKWLHSFLYISTATNLVLSF